MGLIFDIALTHLRARARQTVVSIAGVATGVGFSIAMAALMEGSQRDFVDKIIDATPHVAIKDEFRAPPPQPVERAFAGGAVNVRGLKPREELRGIRNARARMAALEGLARVEVAPTLRGQVVLRYGGRDVTAALVGIEPARERRVSNVERDMAAGSLDSLYRAANGVILGTQLAEKLGAGVGATVIASSPAATVMRMKVVGLFKSGLVQIDAGTAYALLKTVQVLEDRPNVINELRLRLDDIGAARALAARIEPLVGYKTESWEEVNEPILEVFIVRNAIMYTVVGAILVVAAFGIFNVVSTVVHEKTRDIAILKSLGFREGDMVRIFVIEGLALGLIGSGFGWGLGYGLCRALAAIPFELRAMTEVTHLPLFYSPLHYALAAGFALASAVVAAYLPARKAARLNPVDIVRGAA